MDQPLQDVPSPRAVRSMSDEDIRGVLVNCPESPHFMHTQLDLDDRQATQLAADLAERCWRGPTARQNTIRRKLLAKKTLEPIYEVEEEKKEDDAEDSMNIRPRVEHKKRIIENKDEPLLNDTNNVKEVDKTVKKPQRAHMTVADVFFHHAPHL